MVIIERTDLGFERDQLLVAKWAVNRVELEHEWQKIKAQSDIPLLASAQCNESMHVLDIMLSHAIGRMRFWGEEAEQDILGKLEFVEELIHSIRHPEKVKDCLECKVNQGKIIW